MWAFGLLGGWHWCGQRRCQVARIPHPAHGYPLPSSAHLCLQTAYQLYQDQHMPDIKKNNPKVGGWVG